MKKLILLLLVTLSLQAAERPVRVYVDVVGDLFHAGHVQFFKKAKAEGDYLIVGIHGDDACADYKRRPILSLEERKVVIEACSYVDEVIVNSPIGISAEWMKEHEIDLVIHGDDYDKEKVKEQYGVPIKMGKFKSVPYTEGISTSDIIKRIQRLR
ncbi:MAG: Glycerol-3-phosphate cytidylyltransferase [Chlamydiae bacterium]|nr:Glycerol-3-phosphate cytidylyltransferase [Chlamydiota bacterium]